jgi:hypothetical protein
MFTLKLIQVNETCNSTRIRTVVVFTKSLKEVKDICEGYLGPLSKATIRMNQTEPKLKRF